MNNRFEQWQNDINESSIRNPHRRRYIIPDNRPESPWERLDPRVAARYGARVNMNENLAFAQTMHRNQQTGGAPPVQGPQQSGPQLLNDNVQWKDPAQVMAQQQISQMPQIPRVCRLRPGAEFYRGLPVPNSPIPICKFGGNIPGNWNMIDFEVRNVINVYPVGLNETRIDVIKLQQNPHLLKRMVEVGNPMIGLLLVEESVLFTPGMDNRAMINDGMRYPQQPQRNQFIPMQPQQRMIIGGNVNMGTVDPARKKLFLG